MFIAQLSGSEAERLSISSVQDTADDAMSDSGVTSTTDDAVDEFGFPIPSAPSFPVEDNPLEDSPLVLMENWDGKNLRGPSCSEQRILRTRTIGKAVVRAPC